MLSVIILANNTVDLNLLTCYRLAASVEAGLLSHRSDGNCDKNVIKKKLKMLICR